METINARALLVYLLDASDFVILIPRENGVKIIAPSTLNREQAFSILEQAAESTGKAAESTGRALPTG